MVGKIQKQFFSENALFKPVSQDDLVKAISYARESGLSGQWAVRGDQEVSAKELLKIVELACGQTDGSTKPRTELPLLPPLRMLEEFTVGLGIDTNMAEMIEFFDENEQDPVTGSSIWEESGLTPEVELKRYFQYNHIAENDERLAMPTFGSYKMIYTD